MAITRREFGRVALAGVPAAGAALRGSVAAAAATQSATPMSRWSGVQVGLNVPYSLGTGNNIAAEDLLARLVELGVPRATKAIQSLWRAAWAKVGKTPHPADAIFIGSGSILSEADERICESIAVSAGVIEISLSLGTASQG